MIPFTSDFKPPLAGIRVLEAARVLAGPFCGQMLADYGADVIKLERPVTGDDTRAWGPPYRGNLSAYFMSCNRNKRSVTLDLQHPQANRVLDSLLAQSDVLLENFRTDSLEKLHLTPESLLSRFPRLIICSISGFGRTGPMAESPGYDFAVQSLSGLMSITGPIHGEPHKVGVAVTDVLTGLYATSTILACLHARTKSGHGYHIDLALHDCALAAQVNMAQAYLTSGQQPPRQGNFHLQIVPYGLFPTSDGHIVLNVGNDSQWRAFCAVAGTPHAAEQYPTNRIRVERRDSVDALVIHLLRKRTTAEWVKILSEANIPHAVIRNYQDVFADEQVLHRGMKLTVNDPSGAPVDLVGSPVNIAGAGLTQPRLPPELGADTESVLSEIAGLDEQQLAELKSLGVITARS